MSPNWNQGGGGKCSICGSPGTTKATCPDNPMSNNPNWEKHPLAKSPKPGMGSKLPVKKGSRKSPSKSTKKSITPDPEIAALVSTAKMDPQGMAVAMESLPEPALENLLLSIDDWETLNSLCATSPKLRQMCKRMHIGITGKNSDRGYGTVRQHTKDLQSMSDPQLAKNAIKKGLEFTSLEPEDLILVWNDWKAGKGDTLIDVTQGEFWNILPVLHYAWAMADRDGDYREFSKLLREATDYEAHIGDEYVIEFGNWVLENMEKDPPVFQNLLDHVSEMLFNLQDPDPEETEMAERINQWKRDREELRFLRKVRNIE